MPHMPSDVVEFGPVRVTPGQRYRELTEMHFAVDDGEPEITRTELTCEVVQAGDGAPTCVKVHYRTDGLEADGEFTPSALDGAIAMVRLDAERGVVVEDASLDEEDEAFLASDWKELGQVEPLRAAVAGRRFAVGDPAPSVARAVAQLMTRNAADADAIFEAALHHVDGDAAVFQVVGSESQRPPHDPDAVGPPKEARFKLHGVVFLSVKDAQLLRVHLEGLGALLEGEDVKHEARKTIRLERAVEGEGDASAE